MVGGTKLIDVWMVEKILIPSQKAARPLRMMTKNSEAKKKARHRICHPSLAGEAPVFESLAGLGTHRRPRDHLSPTLVWSVELILKALLLCMLDQNLMLTV